VEVNRADVQFVILGCDGVWDHVEEKSNQNACSFMVE
jgi:serine/threonine protein phosphatase PrpC